MSEVPSVFERPALVCGVTTVEESTVIIRQFLQNILADNIARLKAEGCTINVIELEVIVTKLQSLFVSVQELDHVNTIDHSIVHFVDVMNIMFQAASIKEVGDVLTQRYGPYAGFLVTITGLLHDCGFGAMAQSGRFLFGNVFDGTEHCTAGAEYFRANIMPAIRQLLPGIKDEYLENAALAIEHHQDKFSEQEPFDGVSNPLLLLVMLGDKGDRTVARLHRVYSNMFFIITLLELHSRLDPYREELVQNSELIESINKRINEIILGIISQGEKIPEAVYEAYRHLERNRFGPNIFMWARYQEIYQNAKDPQIREILDLLRIRYQMYEYRSKLLMEQGKVKTLYNEVKDYLPLELRALAYKILHDPRFNVSLFDDIRRFTAFSGLVCSIEDGTLVVTLRVRQEEGYKVATRVEKGLKNIYFNGKLLRVVIVGPKN